MNLISDALTHPLARRLGWVLLHSLWQGALVGVAFAACRTLWRKQSSNLRYAAACFALAFLISAPVLTFLYLSAQPASVDAFPAVGLVKEIQPSPTISAAPNTDFGSPIQSFLQWSSEYLSQAIPGIVLLWFGGVVFCSIRLARGWWWTKTLRTRESVPVDMRLMETLNDLCQRIGINRPVRLLKSAIVEVPTVIGWLQPVILMPVASFVGLSPNQLEAVLAHELAHVRRHDHLVNVFQCVVETLMFYHPVVWWISRIVREEREHCCDDFVVEVCGNKLAYAQALVALETARSGLPEFAFAASGGSLVNRLRRLFGMPEQNTLSGGARLIGAALLIMGLVFTILGTYLCLSPNRYLATARVKIDQTDFISQTNVIERATVEDYPTFLETQFEIIRSGAVLEKATGILSFPEKGRNNPDEVIMHLRKNISLHQVRNTKLIEIRVCDIDPNKAARKANAITEAYVDHVREQVRQLVMAGIKTLEEPLQLQEEKIKKVQEETEQLCKKLDISDEDAQSDRPSPSISSETLRAFEKRRIEADNQRIFNEKLLDQIKTLSTEELRMVVPTSVHDSVLSELLNQFNQAEQQFDVAQITFAPEHPERIRTKKLLDTVTGQIDTRIKGVIKGLKAQAEAYRVQAEKLEEVVENAKMRDIQMAEITKPYYEKKRELESLTRSAQILAMKIESEKIGLNFSGSSPVTIVDMAVAPSAPISPNRRLAGVLIGIGLFFDVAGMSMLLAGRRTRFVSPPLSLS